MANPKFDGLPDGARTALLAWWHGLTSNNPSGQATAGWTARPLLRRFGWVGDSPRLTSPTRYGATG